MNIDFEKIELTDASIVHDRLGRKMGKITKLSGVIDDEFIKLFVTSAEYESAEINCRPYAVFCIHVQKLANTITFGSTSPLCPLSKGDHVIMHFDDGETIKIDLTIGGLRVGREKRNYALLSDLQLLKLSEAMLIMIEIFSIKSCTRVSFKFSDLDNSLYKHATEGMFLTRILAKRLIAVKYLLCKEIT